MILDCLPPIGVGYKPRQRSSWTLSLVLHHTHIASQTSKSSTMGNVISAIGGELSGSVPSSHIS